MVSVDGIQATAEEKMQKAVQVTQSDMGTIRTGRANPMLLDRVQVDYFGTPTPISQMANVSVQGGQTIVIQAYDKSALNEIEKAIAHSELNLPANNDGTVIRINIPPLTEETRKEMVKLVKKMGEEGKIAIRNVRRDAFNDLERAQKEENLPEDEFKDRQAILQKTTDRYTAQLDDLVNSKEQEVMAI